MIPPARGTDDGRRRPRSPAARVRPPARPSAAAPRSATAASRSCRRSTRRRRAPTSSSPASRSRPTAASSGSSTRCGPQVEETLGLRVEAGEHPIEVYILSDRKAFEHFLTFYYPEPPPARAFFIAQGDRRVVYTFKGDRLDEDLRHEATHALLHLAVGRHPALARRGPRRALRGRRSSGLNREHLAKLPQDLRDGWTPDLERLEGLQGVQQMSPRDYRESWAWVHYLLHGSSEARAVLLAFLGDARRQGEVKPLSKRLPAGRGRDGRGPEDARRDDGRGPADPKVAANPGEAAVRLQDRPIEIEPLTPPKKRGFLSRLFGQVTG